MVNLAVLRKELCRLGCSVFSVEHQILVSTGKPDVMTVPGNIAMVLHLGGCFC